MSTLKKGFGDFVKRSTTLIVETPSNGRGEDQLSKNIPLTASDTTNSNTEKNFSRVSDERVREITSTGRVRTHSANRQLPGITLRVNEERWEKLKIMSMQERRPLQEILGEALERYMKERGLPW